MRAHTFDVLICSNSFWKFAATISNLQQLVLKICSNFVLFAATFLNLQQLDFICSNFLICSMSLVGHCKIELGFLFSSTRLKGTEHSASSNGPSKILFPYLPLPNIKSLTNSDGGGQGRMVLWPRGLGSMLIYLCHNDNCQSQFGGNCIVFSRRFNICLKKYRNWVKSRCVEFQVSTTS